MLSVEEARARILALARQMPSETVTLRAAAGRVLAEDVFAARASPPFPASAMDGYAVRSADVAAGARLRVIGSAPAGAAFEGAVGAGEAVRIFTGAPVPHGADRILIQEDATASGAEITVGDRPDPGPYVRPAGNDFHENACLAAPRRLSPADLALAAAMNAPSLRVRRQPIVAIVPTGDELVVPGSAPRDDQILSANGYGLAALLEAAGALARLLPIAPDTTEGLARVLALGADADVIVTLGGASVGDHDLVQKTALDGGLDLSFYKIAMRPGKPLMAGHFGRAALIGLPGNPVSSMVCGRVFVAPLISAMLGLDPADPPRPATLAAPIGPNGPRAHFMRARRDARGRVDVFSRQDSALLSVLQKADCLVLRDPNAPGAEAGETVSILDLAYL
ncbi:MAG: gephyrin-like molybdotransferase Glp [Pseudomonadota bacterium]